MHSKKAADIFETMHLDSKIECELEYEDDADLADHGFIQWAVSKIQP